MRPSNSESKYVIGGKDGRQLLLASCYMDVEHWHVIGGLEDWYGK